MSPRYPSTSPPRDPHNPRDFDDLGLSSHQPTTPFSSLLSPYTNPQTLSNFTSPSYTPAELDYSNYQSSELDDSDPFFGVNFDEGVQRTDSIPITARLGNVAYPSTYSDADLNRSLPALPTQAELRSSDANIGNSIYPLSPNHSSIHNTPSPNNATNDRKIKTTISQHELTSGLHNVRFQGRSLAPTVTSIQLTPENSGSSHTSAEGLEPSTMPLRPEQSPHLTISHWGDGQQQNPPYSFIQSNLQYGETNGHGFGRQLPVQQPEHYLRTSVQRDEDGSWLSNEVTGQRGLDPETRKGIADEIPTLKEEDDNRKRLHKNIEVDEWRSQADGSRDTEDEIPSESYFPSHENWYLKGNVSSKRTQEEIHNEIPPLDDGASLHENRLVEGQIYYDINSDHINEADKVELINHPRYWKDNPSMPHITTSRFQPETAKEAMKKFNSHADTISIASRAATWGTRRKSESDFEGILDGGFLKKLSISTSKGKEDNRPRQNSLFDQGLDRLANFARKRSDSKLKRARSSQNIPEDAEAPQNLRHNSQDTLAPPMRTPSFGKRPTPSINTAFAAMAGPLAAVGTTHTRRTSVGAPTISPKSPGHLRFPNIINRVRSRSDLTSQDKSGQTGIADLWRNSGGPPVLAATPNHVESSRPEPLHQDSHDREEDEDEDDEAEENDMKMSFEQQGNPIDPSYEGFKTHVRLLNPDMHYRNKWLVSRIARQQVIRYKSLLELRVKHSQDINARKCSAGPHCSAVQTEALGKPLEQDQTPLGLYVVTEFSDTDSNPGDGTLTEDTFPQGVPMPPTKNLPAEFECQLCFKAKRFQKPSDWTKHVHEDVQPFTCTYETCKESKSFKRKADWVRHENERHRRLEWWICQVDECQHPCYRKDNFLQHLVREHKFPEPKEKTKAAIKKARLSEPAWKMLEQCHKETANQPQDEPCKFCGKTFTTWKKLTVHLAKHMEHISLPILRLVEAKSIDANTIISPIGEQILTPVTPTSRAKFEAHSPFNMDSISPHTPTTSHFPSSRFEQPSYFPTAGLRNGYRMHDSTPQEVQYTNTNGHSHPMYPGTFGAQNVDHSRGFNNMGSDNRNHGNQSRAYGSMDSSFSHPKVEQPRDFGSMDSSFPLAISNLNYSMQQTSGCSNPQVFSTAPLITTYQTSNMLGASDAGYGFDPMALNVNQSFAPLPMNRAHGSTSSFGHSPQNVPQMPYYEHQQ
ncbi:hypothetical protein WAI453_013392 [Rhynchosporium graminicola]|uniref:C2H2-type domain-containing protein n=1 Tax=Rhynchosporium graminicola TaxID=2792576 RepID=A0A1E1K9P9_9HELO|nr:uncharacterized protein RCO7_06593 [Rhynchosporium commune]